MAKKPPKKRPPARGPYKPKKTKAAVFTYYAETINGEGAPLVDRFNELGALGWELLFFSGSLAWFIGDQDTKVPPPLVAHNDDDDYAANEPQPQT
jgi:hypothetical protein